MGSKENIYKSKKNKKWIELFEKFDPEGAGRISTEDFLLALDSDQWPRTDPQCLAARATLKCKVLEYGTSFITLEEFVTVLQNHKAVSKIEK
ncbi:Rhomboid- protein 3 [Tyrophagus putrescentiae]|nr:Rhomboid- protein 3 [Tyrophagus putrescentiae]